MLDEGLCISLLLLFFEFIKINLDAFAYVIEFLNFLIKLMSFIFLGFRICSCFHWYKKNW